MFPYFFVFQQENNGLVHHHDKSHVKNQVTDFGIFGPTAGVLPEILFAYGVTITGGQWILKPLQAFDNIIQGGMPGSKGGYSKKYWVTST